MYFVIFIDDFSRKVWAYFMRHKSKTFSKFKLWKAKVENQTGKKVKYTSDEFRDFYEQHGIKRHFTVRKTPQQIGVAKRMNRSIAEKAQCLRLNVGLAKIFCADAVSMACYLVNKSPRAALDGKVAEEVWTSNEVDYSILRVFGCPTYAHIPSEEQSKLDPKSRQCVFLGYGKGVKDYRFWDPTTNNAVISRDMVFDENSMLKSTQGKEQQVPESNSSDKQMV
jgi:hypothetical protein